MLLTLKIVLLFWSRLLVGTSRHTYARIRRNRLHLASVVGVSISLVLLLVAAIHRTPTAFADGEKEKISFIVSTYISPDTHTVVADFGLHQIASSGENIGGPAPDITGQASPQQHLVVAGETLSEIAALYNLSSTDFLVANSDISANAVIFPGELLNVPKNAATPDQAALIQAQQKAKKAASVKAAIAKSSSTFVDPLNVIRINQRFMDHGHTGVDLGAPIGTTIHAAMSGCFTRSADGWNGGYGNMLILNNGKFSTYYAHLSKRLKQQGDCVEAGDVIGLTGSTGNSTGPHLHFEVRINGNVVNPLNYIPN